MITPPCVDAAGNTRSCSESVLISDGLAQAVAVDDTHIAWTNMGDQSAGTVWVATKDGGTPACVSEYSYPPLPGGSVALRNGYVYWTDFSTGRGSILRAPLDGGPGQLISDEAEHPSSLETSATHVYWIPLWLGEIRRKPLAGGDAEVFAAGELGAASIALDSTHVYWTRSREIRRAPLSGGAASGFFTSTTSVSELVVRGGFVYWVDRSFGAIWRAPVQGAGSPRMVASNQNSPLFMDTDGTQLYWFNSAPTPHLYSAPADGGAPELLLTPPMVGGLVVDGPHLYFGGASLQRLTR